MGKEVKPKEEVSPPEPPETTPKVETPTKSEAEARLEAQLQEKEKSYKGLQTKYNELYEETKKLSDMGVWQKGVEDRLEIMASLLDKRLSSEGLSEDEKVDLKEKFDDLKKKHDIERQQTEFATRIQSYQGKVEALGLSEDDDDYWGIHDAAVSGNFRKADAILRKVEKSKEPPKEEKTVETEEQIKARLKEEVRKEIMLERGELDTETGLPSGGNLADKEFLSKFGSGELPMTKENVERAKKLTT